MKREEQLKKLGFFVSVLAGLFLVMGLPQISRSGSTNVCDGVEDITKHVPIPLPYTVVSKRPIHGLCEMILKVKTLGNASSLISVYAAKDFVIVGGMFVKKQQITIKRINKVKKQEFAKVFTSHHTELENLVVVTYKPAKTGKRYLYFITDPLCSYCNTAKKQIKDLAEKYNFSVKTVFLPVHGKSKSKISAFICGHKTYNDYLNNHYGNQTGCEAGDEYLSKSVELGIKLGISGTPTFVTDNGDLVPGLDTRKVEKLMSGEN